MALPPATLAALTSTVSLHVSVYIDPSNLDAFYKAMGPVFTAVTNEPECVYFEIYQDPEDPGHLAWVENWTAGVDWLMTVQIRKEYYKEYFAVTEPMYVKPREFRFYRRLGKPWVVQKEGNLERVE